MIAYKCKQFQFVVTCIPIW